jgi:hypothetical protein
MLTEDRDGDTSLPPDNDDHEEEEEEITTNTATPMNEGDDEGGSAAEEPVAVEDAIPMPRGRGALMGSERAG